MTLIQFVRKNYYQISMLLILCSAIFVAIGVISTHHHYYYPALLFMAISNILNMFVASIELRSKNGFVFSLSNILFCVVLFIQFLAIQFPVLSSNDWHLGVAINFLYVLDILLFMHCLKGKATLNKVQNIAVALNIAVPIIASILFYCGVPAWIGLSTMVVIYATSFTCLKNKLYNFKKE